MSRNVSQAAREAAYAQQTSEVYLDLLTIEEPSMSTPIRLVNDLVNITSNGEEYTACAFGVVRPANDGVSLPSMQLQIDNVSLELIDIIREMVAPVYVTAELVLASSPDVVEIPAITMQLREINVDEFTITGTILESDWLNSKWPKDTYNMSNYRGLYR